VTSLLLTTLAVTLGVMAVLWLVSLLVRDASIVDLFWGLGFVVMAWTTFALTPDIAPRRMVVTVATTIWGVRLAAYLAWRNLGKGEDYRYREMRARHGDRFWIVSLGTVFLLQGLLMWIVSLPVQAAQWPQSAAPFNWLDAFGVLLWGTGLAFETIADWQLAAFKRRGGRGVLDRGLWRYTRHPNYFGDFLVWWGLGTIAAAGGTWWTLAGPVLMTLLLLKVSGVALLEQSIVERRPAYRDYIARTSAFFPWPPKAS
jgi:steroid 5-alpha reductase family enzyme